jgi:ubiquitin thioesterase OTU1
MILRVRGPEGQATVKAEPGCTVAAFRALLADKTGVPAERQEVRGGFPPKVLQFPDDQSASIASLGVQAGDSLTVTALPAAAAAAAAASTGHAQAAAAGMAGLSEDEQLARAIALSLDEAVPDLPQSAPPPAGPAAQQPVGRQGAAAVPSARAASPVRSHPAPSSSSAGKQQQGVPTAVRLPDGTAVTRRIIDSDNSCLFNAVGYVTERSRKLAPKLRSARTCASVPR